MKDKKQIRQQIIRVRVNEDEYLRFQFLAKKRGYKSLSELIRSLIEDEEVEYDDEE